MKHAVESLPDSIKHLLDVLSFTALLGGLISVLPHISMLLTAIWMAIRIYETDTVQKLLRRDEEGEA